MKEIFEEVAKERESQDKKWGVQNHDPFKWLCILGEEVGEVNKAACDGYDWKTNEWMDLKDYRSELIQVAAVAVSMIECLDRKQWTANPPSQLTLREQVEAMLSEDKRCWKCGCRMCPKEKDLTGIKCPSCDEEQ